MVSEVWLAGASAAAFLAIALLAAIRRAKHELAVHLGLMSVGLFAYNMLEVLSITPGGRVFVWLGSAMAAFTAVPTLELFVGFLGLGRRLRSARYAARIYFGALAVGSLSPLVDPGLGAFYDSGAWALVMLLGIIPGFGAVTHLLVAHGRKSAGRERVRTQLLGGALLLGVGGILCDLAAMAGAGLPRLSYVGLLASSVLIAALTLKARIIEGATTATVLNTAIVALFAVAAQIVVSTWAGDRSAFLLLGSVVVVLVVVAALGPLVGALSASRARARYLATLGRFSQQMAHDVRNPLAAIRGAAQFLKEERAQGRSMDPHDEFVDLIIERTDRIERLIVDYQRMGRLELVAAPVDVNALVGDVLRAINMSDAASIEIDERLSTAVPRIEADRDLLTFALENVVRNACEAMPEGGKLVVTTEPNARRRDGGVRICVRDTGIGMDVRTRERAIEEFFTTKQGGTGLGLAFVGRVVDAHGGTMHLESTEGEGTVVDIELPRTVPASTATAS